MLMLVLYILSLTHVTSYTPAGVINILTQTQFLCSPPGVEYSFTGTGN